MTDFDDDMTAGEYVLGTLDHQARVAAGLRRASDTGFDAMVSAWETRLTPLSEETGEVAPSADLWSAILARIAALGQGPGAADPAGATIIRLSHRVTWWKRATAASMALAACLGLWAAVGAYRATLPTQTLIAVLQKTDDAPGFLVKADFRDRSMAVRPLATAPPSGKSYELWVIDPAIGPPLSLGVLGNNATSKATLPDVPAATLTRATYAVTVEQQGGSPTGAPTGAPVFVGHLLRLDP